MDICIKYCNNIDEANISIAEGFLNIKFGINGTGKSTVSKAIEINSRDVKDLVELTPFKLLEDNPDGLQPTVEGCDEIGSVAFFSEDYIDQFVFKQDELISNSFEIFVKNQQYQQKLEEIEVVVAEINKTFKDNAEIDQVIDDLGELSGCFGKAKSGYSKASAIGKGIGSGNKIENIPKGLELYTEFLKSDQNTNWIKWQIKGNEFLELSDNCPYCVAPAKEKHEEIRLVSSEYDAKSIEHLIKVLSVVERLGQYFSEEARDNLYSITRNKTDLSKEEIVYLKQVKEQIDTLKDKLLNLKKITFFTFDDVGKVIEVIESLKINLGLLALLDSKATRKIVDQLNVSLDTVLDMAGPLQGMVNQQKAAIRSTIDSRKKEINDFLKFAGYRYSVEIEGDNQEYKLKLRHHDISSSVAGGSQYLSYGEKNAFALVLFMYECIANSPDLIVLDDPISSFDKNKKYALLDMMFTGDVSLTGKTVLMLTHDLEPIIDIVKTLSPRFSFPKPKANFLKIRGGVITEIEITRDDIQTFSQICNDNIANSDEVIIKLIYLRRYFETVNDKGREYQLLSSLFHKRSQVTDTSGDVEIDMSGDEIALAAETISKWVDGFDYDNLLTRLLDEDGMIIVYKQCDSDYEKLQIFRVINENHDSSVIRKYINESFHVENEYICQLNPSKYEVIPEFIVQECDLYFDA